MGKLTPIEIHDINRRMAAGTYKYEPEQDEPELEQAEKPKRGRPPKAKREEVEDVEASSDE